MSLRRSQRLQQLVTITNLPISSRKVSGNAGEKTAAVAKVTKNRVVSAKKSKTTVASSIVPSTTPASTSINSTTPASSTHQKHTESETTIYETPLSLGDQNLLVFPGKYYALYGLSPQTILSDAYEHLIRADSRFQALIEQHPCSAFDPASMDRGLDPFESLANSIIGQQVSGAAGRSIRKKFVALFNPADGEADSFPRPRAVVQQSLETLRSAGLSQRKAEYIHGLAEKFASGEVTASLLETLPDDELIATLTKVRGLGAWSVQMFALFALRRPNIFSTGDLGIQRGMAAFAGRDVAKLKAKGGKWKYMTEKEMVEMSQHYEPYRSIFMWYMWKVSDTAVDVLQVT